MGTPAAGSTRHVFFVEAWPCDVGNLPAVDPRDYGVRDVGDGGEKAKGIEFVGSAGQVDHIDIAKAKGAVTDCLGAVW